MNITKQTIGEIVADDYRTAKVFEDYKIDFCCGGNVFIADTCKKEGIDLTEIEKKLNAIKNQPIKQNQNYDLWELPFLADYIINIHHTYLKENTGQIAAYGEKIAHVHGVNHPELFEIATIFNKVAADLTVHLREEEDLFFPAIKRAFEAVKNGKAPTTKDKERIKTSLKTLSEEHEVIGDETHTIRHLAKDYAIPDDVCNTFVVTYQKLKEFEDDLHKHVHLENNILFPKAAQLIK